MYPCSIYLDLVLKGGSFIGALSIYYMGTWSRKVLVFALRMGQGCGASGFLGGSVGASLNFCKSLEEASRKPNLA